MYYVCMYVYSRHLSAVRCFISPPVPEGLEVEMSSLRANSAGTSVDVSVTVGGSVVG